MTLFNNLSPPRHPGAILESITFVNNLCNICTRIRYLRSDQSVNKVYPYIHPFILFILAGWKQTIFCQQSQVSFCTFCIFWRKLVTMQFNGRELLPYYNFFPLYGSQRLVSLPTLFKILSLVFNRRKRFIHVWNNFRVTSGWTNINKQ